MELTLSAYVLVKGSEKAATCVDKGRQTKLGQSISIIESVDSISRDGPDTPIYVMHYKMQNNLDLVTL